MLKEILLVLAGGVCGAFSGIVAALYQAKKARKVRMEETIGEKKVEVCQEAMTRISTLRSLLVQGTLEDSSRFVGEHEKWFWNSLLFLPSNFSKKWLSIRLNLRKAVRREKAQASQTDEKKRGEIINELEELESLIGEQAKKAEEEILNEVGLPPIELEIWHKKKNKTNG